MSEYITNEAYVAGIGAQVVDTATRILNCEIHFLEGARSLCGLRHRAAVAEHDPDFHTFEGIDSETDALPLGRVREMWPDHVLQKLQPQIDKATVWTKQIGEPACKSLINRFDL